MKKLFFYLLIVVSYLLLASPIFANKCGINIGPNYSQVNQVKNLTKEGGWVVALGSPGNCSNFESLFGKGLNVVIRAYNGGQKFTNPQALGWIATLGKMDTKGQKIYFMPWNEPNHPEECGGTPCSPEEVKNYVRYLKSQLEDAGLLNTKVVLLSPSIDKLNPTFEAFRTVYSLGLPSSINAYDQFVSGPCSAAPSQNNCLYDQIGIPAPYYAVETGVAGTCAPWPCYRDSELFQMLTRSWQKWRNDNNFKMFAIFSYDPHRSGSWNIFSASQTINFYQSNCLPGAVDYGNFDPQKFNSWFSSVESQLVNCDGCGYAPDRSFCLSAGPSGEPFYIYPENSLVCTDLDIEYKKESIQITTPTPTPTKILAATQETEMKEFEGILRLEKGDFPSLLPMTENLNNALEDLLPASLKSNLSIDNLPLQTRIKHFVVGKDKDGNLTEPEKIPETEAVQPDWFTKLLGITKIICGIFNICPPPDKLTIKVEQPDLEILSNSLSPNTSCCNGQNTTGESLANITHISEIFKTTSWWTKSTETTEDSITGRKTIRTSENAQLQSRTRGHLVGGETLNKQYPFLNSFLPANLISTRNYALKNNADFYLAPEYFQIKSEEVLNYQNLKAVRAFCLQQCSLLPSSTNIQNLYSFCPSCNTKDYSFCSD